MNTIKPAFLIGVCLLFFAPWVGAAPSTCGNTVLEDARCVGQCSGDYVDPGDGICRPPCDGVWHQDHCVSQCTGGMQKNEFGVCACPDNRPLNQSGRCVARCARGYENSGDRFCRRPRCNGVWMGSTCYRGSTCRGGYQDNGSGVCVCEGDRVIRAGPTARSPSYCVNSCPKTMEDLGNGICSCKEGLVLQRGECKPSCSIGNTNLGDGVCRTCSSMGLKTKDGVCVEACGTGYRSVNDHPTEDGQIDGMCMTCASLGQYWFDSAPQGDGEGYCVTCPGHDRREERRGAESSDTIPPECERKLRAGEKADKTADKAETKAKKVVKKAKKKLLNRN